MVHLYVPGRAGTARVDAAGFARPARRVLIRGEFCSRTGQLRVAYTPSCVNKYNSRVFPLRSSLSSPTTVREPREESRAYAKKNNEAEEWARECDDGEYNTRERVQSVLEERKCQDRVNRTIYNTRQHR